MSKIAIFFAVFSLIFATIGATSAMAVTTPSFPSCVNPQGSVKVNYSSGTHGIVGSDATYTGADAVYTLSSNTLVQCFCPTAGNGVQTNWWKVDGLSDDEIKILKNDGWNYVPTGVVWGLDDAPYVAKNSEYSCNASSSGSANGTGGANILAASTSIPSILGLASTGNIIQILTLSILGLFLVLIGLTFRKHS